MDNPIFVMLSFFWNTKFGFAISEGNYTLHRTLNLSFRRNPCTLHTAYMGSFGM